jgi:hypothetical protein
MYDNVAVILNSDMVLINRFYFIKNVEAIYEKVIDHSMSLSVLYEKVIDHGMSLSVLYEKVIDHGMSLSVLYEKVGL